MSSTQRNLRVGVFLAIAVATLFVSVFLLGQKQSLFHRKVHLRAAFDNAAGLVIGTGVRLAGVDVGVVEKIAFDPDLHVRKVHVVLGVSSAYQERLRADSVARLTSKGLLGDVVIDISVGSADSTVLKDGDELPAQETEGLTEVVRSVKEAVSEVRTLSHTTTGRIEGLLTKQVMSDFGRAMHAIADASDEAAHGHGAVHALLHDPILGENLTAIGQSGRKAGVSAASALARVDSLLAQDDVTRLPTELSRAVKGVADVVTQVRSGDGLVHTLLYEKDRSHLMDNLIALSTTLREVSDEVSQGKGTIGALLKDPTVYQDLKLLLGNLRRSRILGALIRYTISHDGLRIGSPP